MGMKLYNVLLDQDTARRKVKDGINQAVDIVSKTLGAKSRRILIDKEYGEMDASDDGTTILNAIKPEDTQLGAGVKVVQEASAKTNTDEGDGTTTTAVILRALTNELLKEDSQKDLLFKKESGSNLKVRKEIREGMQKVVDYIEANKVEIASRDQLFQIGKVSANSEEIGMMLADIFDQLGKEGAVSIQETTALKTEYEIISGLSFDQGWIAPQFVTNPDREEAVLEPGDEGYVNVLVTSTKIQDVEHFKKLVELFQQRTNDLLIIADDITGVPLNSLVANKLHQIIRVVAVRAPQLGTQAEFLQDICALTGAKLIGSEDGVKFEELTKEHLGKAKRVVVSKTKTIIVGLEKENPQVSERIAVLDGRLERETSEYEKKKLVERISKLKGGVGNIKVGGSTPLEIKDKKAKITDAVSAVRSALRGGVVAGGGISLLLASNSLQDAGGEGMLKKAIQKPFEQIMENSDLDPVDMKKQALESGKGFNVETEEFGNMIEMGVIDPANVVKSTVQNAVSSALMVANLGGLIALVRENHEKETN